MILAERDTHLQELCDLFDRARRGNGSVVVVRGVAGSGRTALLHCLASQESTSGAQFLHAVGSRAERTLPLGIIDQLFRSCRLPAGADSRFSRLLDEAALTATLHAHDPDAVEQAVASTLRQLCAELIDLAADRPLIIGVDDAHHIDVTSLQCLLFLARRIGTSRVLIVLTDRDRPRQVHRVFSSELLTLPNSHQIQLPLLTRQGVASMLVEQLGEQAATLADECWYLSGGNPLLVNGLIQDQANTYGQCSTKVFVGEAFAEAVLICLYRCESSLLVTARGLAVLGDMGIGSGLAVDSNERTAKAVAALEATGLLDAGAFRHPVARRAILDALPPGELTELHRRAAEVLHETGASAPAVAEHLVLAGCGDAEWSADVLRAAGELALSSGDKHQALVSLRLAEQLSTDERQRAAIRTLLTTAEWQIDPGVAAQRMPQLLEAMRNDGLSDEETAVLAVQMMWAGKAQEATEAIERLIRSRDSGNPARLHALAEVHFLSLLYPERYDKLRRRGVLTADDRSMDAMPSRRWLLDAAAGGGMDADKHVAEAEQLLRRPHDDRNLISNAIALVTLIYHDRNDRALYWCDQLLTVTSERSRVWRANFTVIKAWATARRGNPRLAAQLARAGLAMMPVASWGVAIGLPLAVLVTALIDTGALEEAVGLLSINVPDSLFETPFGLLYLLARGRYQMAIDRPDSALADFARCGELVNCWEIDLPSIVPWRTEAAAAHIRLGQHEAARKLAQEQLELSGQLRWARGISLRSLARVSPDPEKVALLCESIELLSAVGDRLELALAYAELSCFYHANGKTSRAAIAARYAQLLVRDGGVAPQLLNLPVSPVLAATTVTTVEGACPDLPELGGVPDWAELADPPVPAAVADLSDAERRVAELAASGHTNRQIALTLYITSSTVEQHLTRIYRKLGISRRSELPHRLEHSKAS